MKQLLFTFFVSLSLLSLSSSHQPRHFFKPNKVLRQYKSPSLHPQESLELTLPLPTTRLPSPSPECTHSLLRHSFGNTYGHPPVFVPYSPPTNCSPPWSHAVLHFAGEISGDQYDRIAGVWISGVEILRASTPEPSESGTFWNVHKDVTRYSSLLEQPNGTLAMMLENIVNKEFTGVYHVNLTILFYQDQEIGIVGNDWNRKLGLGFRKFSGDYERPSDLVIPIADDGETGYWFRITNGSHLGSKRVKIPINARRVMLELYVSFHGDDEFWYSNPPTSYLELNNLTTNRGNGAFREVFVRIDGNIVASEVPFPVVFTGGINPLFWEPVVAIGAFDLPSYEFDLTPFLGLLLDGKSHSFEIGVTNAIQFWLVDANLHVWLEEGSPKVEAGLRNFRQPEFQESWEYNFKQLDGSFEVEAERKGYSSGWVSYGSHNLTTSVVKTTRFKNSITFRRNGTHKTVEQSVRIKLDVKVSDKGSLLSRGSLKGDYPLSLITSTLALDDEKLMTTNLSHALSLREKSYNSNGKLSSIIRNSQEAGGMMLVKGHSVISGVAETRQTLSYQGGSGCYSRSIAASGGKVERDESTSACPSVFHKVLHPLSSWS